jgi:TatA/E family protein of Tat protein translocase
MLAEIVGLDGIVVIVVVLVVFFGGSQIPKLARSLGSARKEFTEGLHGDPDERKVTVLAPGPVAHARAVLRDPAEGVEQVTSIPNAIHPHKARLTMAQPLRRIRPLPSSLPHDAPG